MIRARSFSPQGASPTARQGFSVAPAAGSRAGGRRLRAGSGANQALPDERVEPHAAVLDLHDRAGSGRRARGAGSSAGVDAAAARRGCALRSAAACQRGAAACTCASQARSAASTATLSPLASRRDQRASSLAKAASKGAIGCADETAARLAGALPARRRSAPRSGRPLLASLLSSAAPPSAPAAGCAQLGGARRPIGGLGGSAFLFARLRLLRQSERLGAALRRGAAAAARGHVRRRWRRCAAMAGRPRARPGESPRRPRPATAPGTATAPRPRVERHPGGRRAGAPVAGAVAVDGRRRARASLSSLRSAWPLRVLAAAFASALRARALVGGRARGLLLAAASGAAASPRRRGAAPSSPAPVPRRAAALRPSATAADSAQAIRGRLRRRRPRRAGAIASRSAAAAVLRRGPRRHRHGRRRWRQHRLVHRPIPPEHADQGRRHDAGEAGRDLRSRQPRPEREHAIEQRRAMRGGSRGGSARAAARASARIASRSDGRRRRARIRRVAQRLAQPGVVLRPRRRRRARARTVVAHRAPPGSSGSR